MTIERHPFEIGLCPSPGQQMGREWCTPVDMETSYDEEANRLTVTIYLLKQGRIKPDRILTIYLCRTGLACGCSYGATVGWQILNDCSAKLYWTWPAAANCLLKSGSLVGGKSGVLFVESLGEDPGWPIYPVGDERNPDCPGCGMSDADREAVGETPVPGETFALNACIDEETCLSLYGAGGCHGIGSELFQTVGFMGGVVTDVIDEEARLYQVNVAGYTTGAVGCDLTKYEIGQWVALMKIGTEFPENEYEERVPVTDGNVPTVGIEEYVIMPFAFEGI